MTHLEKFLFVKEASSMPPALVRAEKKLKDIHKSQRKAVEQANKVLVQENERLKADQAKIQQDMAKQQMKSQMDAMKQQRAAATAGAPAQPQVVPPPGQAPYQGMPGSVPPDGSTGQGQQAQAGPSSAGLPGQT